MCQSKKILIEVKYFNYRASFLRNGEGLIWPGLPNPNFRNQEFFLKNQELIRRFSPKNQETFSRNQKENKTVSRSFFFEKTKIFTLTNVCNFAFYEASNGKICLTKQNKEKQRKIITYSLFYWSFRTCSFKNINKTCANNPVRQASKKTHKTA